MRAAPASGRKKCERCMPFAARLPSGPVTYSSVAGRLRRSNCALTTRRTEARAAALRASLTCYQRCVIPVLCSVSIGARGQPTRTLLNREFPHQVLILADNVRGRALDSINAFHDDAGVPIKSRSARKDDKWYRLYCFAERRHALSFQLKFGGELLDRPPPN
jgi:hypothetical protein